MLKANRAATSSSEDQDSKGRPVRVFISYSRMDTALAERLRQTLLERGYNAFLDQHDILPGEPWQERLSGLITSADAVVYCLSPNFISSTICDWEVNEAERLGKRLIPLVCTDVPPDAVPGRLKRLNFIFMRSEGENEAGLRSLETALNVDIAWVRDHTRLTERASEWISGGKRTASLLQGDDLARAERWSLLRPQFTSEITNDVADFISQSRAAFSAQERTRRIRSQVIAVTSVVSLLFVSWLCWVMFGQWQDGLRSQSLFLASIANQEVKDGQNDKGMALAIEALPDRHAGSFTQALRPYVPEAHSAFVASNSGATWESTLWMQKILAAPKGAEGSSEHVEFSADNNRFLTMTDEGKATVWNVATGHTEQALQHPHRCHRPDPNRIVTFRHCAHRATFSESGNWVVTTNTANSGADQLIEHGDIEPGQIVVWNARSGLRHRKIAIPRQSPSLQIILSRNGRRVLSTSNIDVQVWDIESGTPLVKLPGKHQLADLSADGSQLVALRDGTISVWDLDARKTLHSFAIGSDEIQTLLISKRRNAVLVVSASGIATRWSLENPAKPAQLNGHDGTIYLAALSPNGERLATAGSDTKLIIWDVVTLQPTLTIPLKWKLEQVRFSPGGDKVLFWEEAGQSIDIWALDGSIRVASLGGHNETINSTAISRDGRLVATTSSDGSSRLWSLSPLQDLIDAARTEGRARCPSETERRELFLDKRSPAWCTASNAKASVVRVSSMWEEIRTGMIGALWAFRSKYR